MRHTPPHGRRRVAAATSRTAWALWLGLAAWLGATHAAAEPPPSTKDREFFETRIRPVLITHCYECHGPDAESLGGGLRLDHRDGLRQGGASGPALVAGAPSESVLIHALRHAGPEMPPGESLPEPVIRDFEEWVRRGAADPRDAPAAGAIAAAPAAPRSDLWSLQPVADPQPPSVQTADWPRDPLDRFVLARIEAAGLAPTHDAPPRTLVRRLFVDLLGLPPTAAEIEAFEAAHAARGEAAIAALVDDLLARPQFGERWARHWLDVARYGESNGNDGLGRNPTFPHAWRYRDYVIAAFNADMPFDRFVTEQLAGDLLPAATPEDRDRQRVATGFLALGAKPAKAMNDDFAMDVVADQIDVVGRGLLGLGVACARCHDHKFDPIPTRDYYALAGIFTSTETLWGMAGHEGLTAPPTDLHVLEAAPHVPPPEDFVETVLVIESNTGKPKPPPKPKWPPGTPLAMGVRDVAKPDDCKINVLGASKKLGEPVPRGFLSAFGVAADVLAIGPQESGRLQLARWITAPDHPLTARVFVNRVWQHLFGAGLVATPDDFGVYGQPPADPALLDHLATRFVRDGWSIKRLIRSIVTSHTYRLDSAASGDLTAADPANDLLARHARRRLDAETLRDAMLAASGELDLEPPAGSIIRHRDILVNLAGNLHEPSNHRSVYLCYLRSSPPPALAAFDLPDFTEPVGRRDESTVAGHALHLFNSEVVVRLADRFARRLVAPDAAGSADTDEARVQRAFRSALGRDPTAAEARGALDLVASLEGELAGQAAAESDGQATGEPAAEAESHPRIRAWAGLCQALLSSNEFRYVD